MKVNYLMGVLSLVTLTACDSYVAQQYQSNPQNAIALQSVAASGKRATVVSATLAEGVEARPTCRLAGPIDLGGGQDAASVVREALLAELLAGGVYKANGTPLTVTVTKLDPDTFAGTWDIGLSISSPKGSMSILETTKYSTSFTAVAACNNTATAFNRALSNTILRTIQDPRFKNIL